MLAIHLVQWLRTRMRPCEAHVRFRVALHCCIHARALALALAGSRSRSSAAAAALPGSYGVCLVLLVWVCGVCGSIDCIMLCFCLLGIIGSHKHVAWMQSAASGMQWLSSYVWCMKECCLRVLLWGLAGLVGWQLAVGYWVARHMPNSSQNGARSGCWCKCIQ